MNLITSYRAQVLEGEVIVPGDKSVSHRALVVGALAIGKTRVVGLLESADVLATANATRALGSSVEHADDGSWRINGCGIGSLVEPDDILDMGNSGTAARLLIGLLSTHPIKTVFTGDASLRARPMERLMTPLRQFGARFEGPDNGRLPLMVVGAHDPIPVNYQMPIASAQVKSAILLGSLNTAGETTVIEPLPTRDHTERMLRQFGADLHITVMPNGQRQITIVGEPELEAQDVFIPGDFSSAAFPLAAALLVPGSEIRLPRIGVNQFRIGLLETLSMMGAAIKQENVGDIGGEPIADLVIKAGHLTGIEVPPGSAPSMIDEYPILSIIAACADGTTIMHGLSELRVKESDRLSAIAKGLAACGVAVEETHDSLTVHGNGKGPRGGAIIDSGLDHRIAMAFLVLGMVSEEPITVTRAATINTSFPGFVSLMEGLGADLRIENN